MPAGSAAALIRDTGALLDYLVESAPDHRLFRNAIDQARTRYAPALVLAEIDYFLRNERRAIMLGRERMTLASGVCGQRVGLKPAPTRLPICTLPRENLSIKCDRTPSSA
ncbi:MAG TPA: hypothetical protein VH684_08975 [Xanthobacteraceae bacterium]